MTGQETGPQETGQQAWRPLRIDGFMGLIGPLHTRRHDGRKRYGLHTDARHGNAIGTVHGGVVASLLDQVIALEAWNAADRRPTATVQMDTRFLGAARPGDVLEASAAIRRTSRALVFVDAEATRGGDLLATATAIMKILNRQG